MGILAKKAITPRKNVATWDSCSMTWIILTLMRMASHLSLIHIYPNDEGGLMWNDPTIGIEWPALEGDAEFDPSKIILSEKDKIHPSLGEV